MSDSVSVLEITKWKRLPIHGNIRGKEKHHELFFTEGMEMLLKAEEDDRSDKRFERLQRAAHFRYQASIQELHMEHPEGWISLW